MSQSMATPIRVERNRMESLDGKLEGQEALVMAAIQGMGFGQGLALAPFS